MSEVNRMNTLNNLSDKPVAVTDETFEDEVLSSDLPVVVDFWAPWCGPCRMVAPILDDFAQQYAGRIRIAKVNTDEHSAYASHLGIMGIPTMIFFHQGQEMDRIVGALPRPALQRRFEAVLNQFEPVQA